MGVVQRQAFKESTLAYVGAIIGICSQLWIYPLAFGAYGDFQFILSMVYFFVPLASFGVISLTNRYYPYFEKERKGYGFLSLLLALSTIGFFIFLGIITIFYDEYLSLLGWLGYNVETFEKYNTIIISSVFFSVIATLLTSYANNLKRIVVPFIITSLSMKIILPILILLVVFDIVQPYAIFNSIVIIKIVIAACLFFYIKRINGFRFVFKKSEALYTNYKSMLYFATYGMIAGYGSILAFNIDKIMVRGYTTDYDTGIYATILALTGLVLYPYNAVIKMTTPFAAKAWKENDIDYLKDINKKTTNSLTFLSLFIFIIMAINVKDVFSYTSNRDAFMLGLQSFYFLGFAKMISGAFGINILITTFSKQYYILIVATLLLAITNVSLNYILIPKYGMTGAAVATAVSVVVYNLFNYFFNWIKLGIQGLEGRTLLVVALLLVSAYISSFINPFNARFLNIITRSMLFSMLTVPIIFYYNLVPEMNVFLRKTIAKLK